MTAMIPASGATRAAAHIAERSFVTILRPKVRKTPPKQPGVTKAIGSAHLYNTAMNRQKITAAASGTVQLALFIRPNAIGQRHLDAHGVQSSSTESIAELTMVDRSPEIPPDCLMYANYEPSSSAIELRFSDKTFSLPIARLEMPMDRIDWPTLKASPGGEKIVVKGIRGDPVPIDSATLRYLVDEKYATKMDEKLKSLQFTDEELEQLDLDEPPHGFIEQADIDLTRESWK